MMDNIIKGLSSEAFSDSDIITVCDGETKIIRYPELYNYRSINDLVTPHNNVVILYETKRNYGHWVCLIKHKNTIEFYDPYGIFIDDQLNFIDKKFRRENNECYPILTKMIYDSRMGVIYNNVQLQGYLNDISTCGRHVAMRIVMRDMPLSKYIKMLTSSNNSPDEIVTYLTAFQR